MKKTYLYIFALLLFACHKDKSAFEQKLLHSKWVYCPYQKVTDKVRFVTYIKFYENQSYENFHLESNIKFGSIDGHKEPKEWFYDEERKGLIITGNRFKVLSVNKDTIYLQKEDKSKALLFRVGH